MNRNALELQKSRKFKDEKINTNAITLPVDNGDKRQWFYFNLLPFRCVSGLLLLPEFIFFFFFFFFKKKRFNLIISVIDSLKKKIKQ